MALFEKYGEFDTYQEINAMAEKMKAEGKLDEIKVLASENGIDDFDTEDFINGDLEELCDPMSAAIGKLKAERLQLGEKNNLADDIVEYLQGNCDDVKMQIAIRKKGKRVDKAFGEIVNYANNNTYKVNGRECRYCPPMKGFALIKAYYLEV